MIQIHTQSFIIGKTLSHLSPEGSEVKKTKLQSTLIDLHWEFRGPLLLGFGNHFFFTHRFERRFVENKRGKEREINLHQQAISSKGTF